MAAQSQAQVHCCPALLVSRQDSACPTGKLSQCSVSAHAARQRSWLLSQSTAFPQRFSDSAPLPVSALVTACVGVEGTCLTGRGLTGSLGANRLRSGGTTTGRMRPAHPRPEASDGYHIQTSHLRRFDNMSISVCKRCTVPTEAIMQLQAMMGSLCMKLRTEAPKLILAVFDMTTTQSCPRIRLAQISLQSLNAMPFSQKSSDEQVTFQSR